MHKSRHHIRGRCTRHPKWQSRDYRKKVATRPRHHVNAFCVVMQKARRCVSSTFFSRGCCFHFEGELVCNHHPHHIEDDKRLCRSIKGHCNTGESESLCFAVAVWGRPMPCRVYVSGHWDCGERAWQAKTETRAPFTRSQLGRINVKKKEVNKIDRERPFVIRGGLCVCCDMKLNAHPNPLLLGILSSFPSCFQ